MNTGKAGFAIMTTEKFNGKRKALNKLQNGITPIKGWSDPDMAIFAYSETAVACGERLEKEIGFSKEDYIIVDLEAMFTSKSKHKVS